LAGFAKPWRGPDTQRERSDSWSHSALVTCWKAPNSGHHSGFVLAALTRAFAAFELQPTALELLETAYERDVQRLVYVSHRMQVERAQQVGGDVLDVRLVLVGEDDVLDARPLGAKDLLLEPPDGERPAAQRDLARH